MTKNTDLSQRLEVASNELHARFPAGFLLVVARDDRHGVGIASHNVLPFQGESDAIIQGALEGVRDGAVAYGGECVVDRTITHDSTKRKENRR